MEESAVQVMDVQAQGGPLPGLISLIIMVLIIAGGWKMFTKAEKPGWAILIPIYNAIVMLQIAQKPIWWIILMFVPVVNLVIGIIMCIAIAKNFGKGTGFGIGLALLAPIFIPILGFGSATYSATPPAMPQAA